VAIPFPSPITTERLLIRTPSAEDAEQLNEAIRETFDQLHRWMPWAPTVPSLEESLTVCNQMATKTGEEKDFALFCFDKQTGRFILASGCHPINLDIPSYMIGYWCRESEQGKGYTTEAVKAIRDAAFQTMKARRVEIRCEVENEASKRVAEKCGFPLEAKHQNDCRNALGNVASTYVFALTSDGA
jgi:ribosomal-protein-serine acetyltransferase